MSRLGVGNSELGTRKASIKDFEDLIAWQKSQDLAVMIHKISSDFPKSELYGLTSQVRRAAYSVSANIAEGFGRYSPKEKSQFYKVANGSLLETKSFCYLAKRLNYLTEVDLNALLRDISDCQRLVNALIKSIREKYGL